MFLDMEKKELAELLKKGVVPGDVLTLDGLHGLLFGLAVSPDMVMPEEWLKLIYGREMAVFDSRKQADRMISIALTIYTRFVQDNEAGKLVFPFDIGKMSGADIPRIRDWCQGLMRVLSIDPEVWGISEHGLDPAAMTEEAQELHTSLGIVSGIAFPEDAPEIFKASLVENNEDNADSGLQAKIFFFVPMAVDYIQAHGSKLRKQLRSSAACGTDKIGRNDLCPCNSGKKYKKCCGA